MTKIEELERIMETEVEVGESLLSLLARKQQSIVGLQGELLSSLVEEEERLMKPLRDLEGERVRLTAELAGVMPSPPSGPRQSVTILELVEVLPAVDAVRISSMAQRLRTIVERILHQNAQNRLLLQRSLRFVQETLRFVTDDHTRTLVDQRV